MPKPNPALKRLGKLIGTWKLRGRMLGSKKDNISEWTTFEWMAGGFYLKASSGINFKGMKMESVEIIGYDPASRTFPSSVYSSMSGEVLPYAWNVQGNKITHWMAMAKYTGTLSKDGKTLSGGWRAIKGNKSSDKMAYDAVMVRVKC